MALPWTDLTLAAITNIGTTELFSSAFTLDGNQAVSGTVQSSAHANDDLTVTVYTSDDGTTWGASEQFQILANDTDGKSVGPILLTAQSRIGVVASGATDTPTLTLNLSRVNMNAA